MSKFAPNPKKVQNYTQADERKTFVGKRKAVELLPNVLQTEPNKQFFDTTIDNLLSSGTTETLNTYWGRVSGRTYQPETDLFNREHRAERINYQLSPGMAVYDATGTVDISSYIHMLDALKHAGANVNDLNEMMASEGQTLNLPINIDMFVNYNNYYWLPSDVPVCEIDASVGNPVDIDDIIKVSNYVTPVLTNGKQLEFLNGMIVKFVGSNVSSTSGDFIVGASYIVEGVGSSNIKLILNEDENGNIKFNRVQAYSFTIPADPGEIPVRVPLNTQKDYVVMNRSAVDKNSWARANQWYSVHAIRAAVEFNDLDMADYVSSTSRGRRPIIEFDANMELFNAGKVTTSVVEDVEHLITDGSLRVDGSGSMPSQMVGIDIDVFEHDGVKLNAGERVMFHSTTASMSESFAGYHNQIYKVGVDVNNEITLLPEMTINPGVDDGTKVLVNHASVGLSGSEWVWDDFQKTWKLGQYKKFRGQAPLFNLYNKDGQQLFGSDTEAFRGEYIWHYAINSAGVVDEELGFAPKYNSQVPNDFVFEFTLNNKRYTRNVTTDFKQEIDGDYFYKNALTGELHGCWNTLRDEQSVPVILTHIVTEDSASVQIPIGTTIVERAQEYTVSFDNGKFIWSQPTYTGVSRIDERNPTMVFAYDTAYTINQLVADSNHAITFTDPYGNVDGNISVVENGTSLSVTIASAYPYSTVLYSDAADITNNGVIYLSNDNHTAIVLRKDGTIQAETTFSVVDGVIQYPHSVKKDTVFDISVIPQEKIDDAVYDVAPSIKYNAANTRLNSVSMTQMIGHFEDQLLRMPGRSGEMFGINSYHKSPRLHNYGGTIRRQVYSPAKLAFLLKHNETNPFNAMHSLANDYVVFKTAFRNKVAQLWKTGSHTTVRDIVDTALVQLNIGKNSSFKYARSDMAFYENYHESEYVFAGGTPSFTMETSVNQYGDVQNHVQIWAYEYDSVAGVYYDVPLINGVDYTIDVNIVTMLRALSHDGNTSNVITVRAFNHKNNSFIPPSVVKLGFKRPTQVEVVDAVLHMHDGSEYKLTGSDIFNMTDSGFDVIAAALYDLELRISNNLRSTHSQVVDIDGFMPAVNYNTGYMWNDTIAKLDDWYNRWVVATDIVDADTFADDDYYNVADKFTWNYKSVYPFIGGWEGIYTFFFGTVRPHTHPWEMLGHNTKPQWWDANYNWTDTAPGGAREKLINALKFGVVGDPSLAGSEFICDVRYARPQYDWDNNTLVSTAGVLQDPVAANVVPAPSAVDASKPFAFGDWGPYESLWRKTSNYQYAKIEMLFQLKPFTIFETYWHIGGIAVNTMSANMVKYFTEFNGIEPLSSGYDLHNHKPDGGFVSHIDIRDGGTGHNTSSVADIQTNSNMQATIKLSVANGAITGASVTNPGSGYDSDSKVVVISDFGVGEDLVARIDTSSTLPRMGMNNVMVEWSKLYGISSDELNKTIARIQPQLMLHLGGYSDKNILDLVVDTSLNGGRVSIPSQDYSITLTSGAPVKSVFYSGVSITKTVRGFTVEGFNTRNRQFQYHAPSEGGSVVVETIGNITIDRYLNFKSQSSALSYGHEFIKRQELFNFLVGLGEFYSRESFDVAPQWIIDAKAVITWSLTAELGESMQVNGITDVLVYEQGTHGFVQNVDVMYDGMVNVVDVDRRNILAEDMMVLRDYEKTEFSMKDSATSIYGINVNVVEYEHVINIANTTQFNDIVYNPVTGVSVERIKIEGERTRQWNGRVEAPGYIVQETGIRANFESSVREVEKDLINTESKTLSKATRQTARFNVGYRQPTYLTETFVEDNTAYAFSKGVRKYKGTTTAIDAFAKNRGLFGSEYDYTLNEEWMIRLGDYGDKQRRNPIEIEVHPDLIKSSPQIIRFNDSSVVDRSGDSVIDIGINDPRLVTSYQPKPFTLLPMQYANDESIAQSTVFNKHFKTSGLPRIDEIDVTLKSVDDITSAFDPESEYALINNWENKVSYKLGDKVRYQGVAYEAIVNNTGIDVEYNDIVVAGSVWAPTIESTTPNFLLIIDGEYVNFYKTDTTTTFNIASVTGTTTNPSVTSGTTLSINGSTITLNKTVSLVTYSDIVFTGTVISPIITGKAGAILTVDQYAIDFERYLSSTTNITAFDAVEGALIGAGIGAGTASTLATARINAFNDLSASYRGVHGDVAWGTWLSSYFAAATEFAPAGLNVVYLQTEHTAASGLAYEADMLTLLQNDIDIINAVQGTSHTTASTGINIDISATIALVDDGQYVSDYTAELLSNVTVLSNVVVATETTPTALPYQWQFQEIIDHINATLSSTNIVASADASNHLVLTKVPTVNDTSMQLIDSDTNVPDVLTLLGLSAETRNSTGTETSVAVNLNLADVISAINEAGISNVYASALSNSLVITATEGNLVIGAGSANSIVGIVQGTYVRSEVSETESPIQLQIYHIVDQINAAGIPGVTASNVGNKVVLTSTNSTMDIGPGSANALLGFEEGIIEATTVASNTWVESEWQEIVDPAVFSIWVTDDVGHTGLTNRHDGYNVYQVMDFGIEIDHICAGIINTDDAKVETKIPVSLQEGDYIMILGSTCEPSVDGIHTVIEVDNNNNHFLIDEFIEKQGDGGKLLVIRQARFKTSDDMWNTGVTSNGEYFTNGDFGWNAGMFAYVDDVIVNGTPTGVGAVYTVAATSPSGVSFKKIRSQIQKVDNSQIENVVVYDPQTNDTKGVIEIFDPMKGILPGVVSKEIDFIHDGDIAVYSHTTDLDYDVRPSNYWSDDKKTKVWWDISNAIYLDYEQDDIDYTQSNWARLYPTATIDVYEWTKSPVTPDEYEAAVKSGTVIDDVMLSGVPYKQINAVGDEEYYWSEEVEYVASTNSEQTYYYFWVKDKVTVPSDERTYTTTQLAELIKDPLKFGISWAAAANSRVLLINALERYLDYGADVVQVNFANRNVNYHQEYILIAENDPTLTIPEWLHDRLCDSLSSYDNATTTVPFVAWDVNTSYSRGDVVKRSDKFYMANHTTETGVDPLVNDVFWSVIINAIENPDGIVSYFDDNGNRASVEYIKYPTPNAVPDHNLHRFNRYGNEVRPRQSWFNDITSARRTVIESINEEILKVNLVDSNLNWEDTLYTVKVDGNTSVDLSGMWTWADWSSAQYDATIQPDFFVKAPLNLGSLTPKVGQIALVQTNLFTDKINRESVYKFTANGWELIWKEKATVQFLDKLWDYVGNTQGWGVGGWNSGTYNFDPASYLGEILDLLRTNIFVGQYAPLYNNVWFTMMHYSLGEQKNHNWAFKTSYVKMALKINIDKQPKKFIKYRDDVLTDFINDIKPYHTKLRDVTLDRNVSDSMSLTIDDIARSSVITDTFGRVNAANTVWSDLTVDGNDVDAGDVDYMDFTTTDPSIQYVYDGGGFDASSNYDHDDELVPTSLAEAIEIRVNTNVSGATEDANSKKFRMFFGANGMYEATVISTQTTLASAITKDDTVIPVVDGSLLWNPTAQENGVVWIDNERIEYTHVDNNKLMNCVRHAGGTSNQAHDAGTAVFEGGHPLRIPTHNVLSGYGDDLRLAFNDFGKSITDNTSVSPEAVFVYQNG